MKKVEEDKGEDWSMVLPIIMSMGGFGRSKEDTESLKEQIAYLNGKVDMLEKILADKKA